MKKEGCLRWKERQEGEKEGIFEVGSGGSENSCFGIIQRRPRNRH